MDAFDFRAGGEDFAEGFRLRQVSEFAAGDLEADPGQLGSVFAGLVEVGALQGAHEMEQAAQDEIVSEARDAFHRVLELRFDLGAGLGTGVEGFVRLRIKAGGEQVKDQARDGRIARDGGFLDVLRLIEAALAAVGGECADQRGLAPGGAGSEHETVEPVIVGFAAPDGDEGIFQRAGETGQRQRRAVRRFHGEGVDPVDVRRIGDRLERRADGVAGFELHEETQVLEHRHAARKRNGAVAREDLDTDFRGIVGVVATGARDHRATGAESGHAGDVAQGLVRREGFAVGGVEGADKGTGPFPVAAGEIGTHEQVAEALVPGAGERDDLVFDLGRVRLRMAGRKADLEVNARHRSGVEVRLERAQLALVGLGEHGAHALAQGSVIGFARDEDERGDEPVELVAAQEDFRPGTAYQVQRAHDHRAEQRGPRLEQLVARPGLDQVGERLLRMSAGGGAGGGHDLLHAAAHERDRARGLVIGFGGEQAEEADFAVHAALRVVFLDADIVARHAAVHAARQGRLGDDQRRRMAEKIADLLGQHERFAVGREDVEVLVAQDAEVRAVDHQRLSGQDAAGLVRIEIIFAAAEEHIVLLQQPFEKGDGFVALDRRDVLQAGQAFHLGAHPGLHGAVVGDGALHIGERGAGAGLEEARLAGRQERRVYLDDGDHPPVGEGDDRVEERLHFMALRGAFVEKRIDEEGHVGTCGLDHGAPEGAFGAVCARNHTDGLRAGRNLRRPGPELLAEQLDVGLGETGEVFAGGFLQELFKNLALRPGSSGGTCHGSDSP